MTDIGYLGFANLPNQVQRKYAKKGFEFTLMVVGESGLGKTTLTNSLFDAGINIEKKIPTAQELLKKTLSIETNSIDIEDRGVRLKLTVVDTPGYGDAIDASNNFEPILTYIDEQFEKYLSHETGLNRRQIRDSRVHCCFYFISPLNCGLKPADIHFLKLLQHKTNIVPLIAKSDFLTPSETKALKKRIMDEIREHKISIYTIPDCDPDEESTYKQHVEQLKNAFPFAVCSSLEFHDVKGRKIRGREYPFGIVEIENPQHSDFVKLRSMLVSHMQDMRELTNDLHYENYRSERLSGTISPKFMNSTSINDSNFRDNVSIVSGNFSEMNDESEKDRLLQEKQAEILRMQAMLSKMQEEMRQQQQQQKNLSNSSLIGINNNPSPLLEQTVIAKPAKVTSNGDINVAVPDEPNYSRTRGKTRKSSYWIRGKEYKQELVEFSGPQQETRSKKLELDSNNGEYLASQEYKRVKSNQWK